MTSNNPLSEQIEMIAKAGAYDILAKRNGELNAQKALLRRFIQLFLEAESESDLQELKRQASELLKVTLC